MNNKRVAIGASLIALVCLGSATGVALQFQARGGATPPLSNPQLQGSAGSQACAVPARVVPGSYHADPLQIVGDWVVVTYTADCYQPGQPALPIDGYAARGSGSIGCGGSSSGQPATTAAAGRVSFEHFNVQRCGDGGPAITLTLVTGHVAGVGAVSMQVDFASAFKTSGPFATAATPWLHRRAAPPALFEPSTRAAPFWPSSARARLGWVKCKVLAPKDRRS